VSDDSQQTPPPAKRDTTSSASDSGTPEQKGHDARREDLEHHSGAVERARADLAAGRAWKARDRLTGHLADNLDPEALELLGEVHYAMGDMPAAGAAWFGTGRRGQDVDEAVEAWRERHNDHFDQMWRSLPRTVRDNPGNPRVEALRRRAGADRTPTAPAPTAAPHNGGGGVDAAVVITVVLAVLFVICAVVGAVTVLRWILPG
jgi:hypothetical protein